MEGPTVGVGAIVVHEGALLMVRRGRAPGAGLWSIPGGRVERGEHLADALRREVKEETGIDVAVGDFVGFLELVGEDSHYVLLDFLATASGDEAPIPGDDVDAVRWVPLDKVRELHCTPRFVETLTAWGVLR
jgi:ADP-ribose pyrophosphatase YjhB (NUDIX family)